MAKKQPKAPKRVKSDAYIAGAGIVVDQPITQTLETNYMPYAMSVIVSRALPEIDGFKPSHRKLLYTMYKMGLLNGAKTKSANIVGQTMHLNPHGDQAIYDTMVRLSKGYEALLHPYVDSKGNFGKAYSRDMAWAASRYTEAKLAPICIEFFREMDKDTVDFIPNYDNTTVEPVLLPSTFPSILVNSNVGIAVSMASNICPFNLKELCETTIAMLKNPDHDLLETLKGPDFPSGGYILYDKQEIKRAIDTGRGGIKVRCKYNYDENANCIEVTEIPSTTTIEAIIDKIVDLVKLQKIKEISDLRDETDLSGLKLTLDLKRGVDPEKLMRKLYKMTPLQDNYSCNFNILIDGYPRVMGVKEILNEWIKFRLNCIKRRVSFDLRKKQEKLHLLEGLEKILLDIDKAVKIVRQTDEEKEVVPNLMIGFGIDEIQAEFVAEIKLRHLNQQYILGRTKEIADLLADIAKMENILANPQMMKTIIIDDLKNVIEKYQQPRKTMFIYEHEILEDFEEEIVDYPVNIFFSKEGYFKKVTPQSLRMSNEHKLKENDEIINHIETMNSAEILFFTDQQQVYKSRASDFEDTKISSLGDYIPAKLVFDQDEKVVLMVLTTDYAGKMVFFFDNGKVAKVPLSAYQTKTNRKKLANAYCEKFKLAQMFFIDDDKEFVITSTAKRKLLFNTAMIAEKTTKNTQGIQVMKL
ncbi:MAG: DNA topoisomerase (ATP-hydrolyzing) subunit A, partial [Oscillospiraceae bacterium]